MFLGKDRTIAARWLSVILLLLVQIHICHAKYILPSGETCKVCVTLPACDVEAAENKLAGVTHGDCHDCCQIKPCDDGSKVKAAVSQPIQSIDIDLPPVPKFEVVFYVVERPIIEVPIDGAPPTGPPSATRSRAPPTQLV